MRTGDVRRVPSCFRTEIARLAGARVAIRRRGEVRDGIHTESDPQHDDSSADPHGSVKGRAEVAYDQQSRCSGDLVGGRYPSGLAAGERKPTFYRRDCDAD